MTTLSFPASTIRQRRLELERLGRRRAVGVQRNLVTDPDEHRPDLARPANRSGAGGRR